MGPWLRRLLDGLDGPPPRNPRRLDELSERWAGLRPRARRAVALLAVLLVLAGHQWRVSATAGRWGGTEVPVLVAPALLPVGTHPVDLRRLRLPPAAVPPDAVTEVRAGALLSMALPAGAILTRGHLDPRGPAAGLPEGLRALPLPVEEGWGLAPGAWVDVWVLAATAETGQEPAVLIARGRPVLEVRLDGRGATALVGLATEEMAAATAGLATGRVLLTHAPPPG